jgi:hypothetical protein
MSMATVSFDTLRFPRKLEQSGFTHDQAVGAAEALADTMGESVATKADLNELEMRLTVRFGTMLAAAVAIVVALDKLN